MNITMSRIWVINMTQSLHWSPISSQHRAWNVPLLQYIITISLRQTPEQGRDQTTQPRTRDIKDSSYGSVGEMRRSPLENVRSSTFRNSTHDRLVWLSALLKTLCCKQTKYYVMLFKSALLFVRFQQLGYGKNDDTHFLENLQI